MPLDITSDKGSQFTSSLWNEIAHQLRVQLHKTTAYHLKSNGLVERFHRNLKGALKARLQGPYWADELPWVLLGLKTAPTEDLGSSAAELVYGVPLRLPGEFIDPAHQPFLAWAPNDPFYTKVKKTFALSHITPRITLLDCYTTISDIGTALETVWLTYHVFSVCPR